MKIKSISFFTILLISGLVLSACGESGPKAPGKYAEVAKCLTQKGVIMYGAYWCPHCANQKQFFGDDFQFVTYQECDDQGVGGNHKLCLERGVTSYPTWIFPGQGNLTGEQKVIALAKLANCEDKLPQEDQANLKALEEQSSKQPQTVPSTSEATASSKPVDVNSVSTIPNTK